MKPPESTMIGGARKTLPTGRARKISKPSSAGAAVRKVRSHSAVTREQQAEWVKISEQK